MEASMRCSGPTVGLLLGIKFMFHALFQPLCVNQLGLI
jgi:hypothetical protein